MKHFRVCALFPLVALAFLQARGQNGAGTSEMLVALDQGQSGTIVEKDENPPANSDQLSPPDSESGRLIKEEDDGIIRGEGEESIIEHEKSQAPAEKAASGPAAPTPASTPTAPASAAQQPAAGPSGPIQASHPQQLTGGKPGVSPSPAESAAPVEPVIEKARSINFAKNLKEYRSPRLAMFMSLIVPGLGQVYAQRYVKAGIFVAAEAAIIGVSVHYYVKGKELIQQAHGYANANYDTDRFWRYYANLDTLLRGNTALDSSGVADVKQSVLSDSAQFASDAAGHTNAFYEAIGEIGTNRPGTMVQGWKDCEPVLGQDGRFGPTDASGYIDSAGYRYLYVQMQQPGVGDTVWLLYQIDKQTHDTVGSYLYGYSPAQHQFSHMVNVANGYYRISSNVLFLLIVNHVISAVDALISAKAHNDELLGKESFWRRISLDQEVAFNGTDVKSTFGVRIRF